MSKSLVLSDIGLGKTSAKKVDIGQKIGSVKADFLKENSCVIEVSLQDVDSIESNAFEGCSALAYLEVPGLDYSSIELFGSDKSIISNLAMIDIVDHYDSDGKLVETKLGKSFANLSSLNSISFPSSLSSFDKDALAGDDKLESLFLDNNVKVEDDAFTGVSGLISLWTPLPNSVTSLGLSNLTSLESLHILKYTEDEGYSLKSNILKGIANSIELKFEDDGDGLSSIEAYAFEGIACNSVNLSSSSVNLLKTNTFKRSNINTLYLNDAEPLSVKTNAFNQAGNISVLFNDGFAAIAEMNPHGAAKLTIQEFRSDTLEVVAPSGMMNVEIVQNVLHASYLRSIGERSFSMMNNLSAAMVNTVDDKAVPQYCFADNYNLQEVTLGDSISSIESHAFENDNSLTSISLSYPDGVVLKANALENLYALNAINLDDVIEVRASALMNCYSIETDEYSLQNISSIGDNAFENTIDTAGDEINYVLDESVFASIGKDAFKSCKIFGFQSDITLNEFNNALSSKIGRSLIPSPLYDAAKIKEIHSAILEYLGISNETFTLTLADFTINKDGTGNDYKCIKYADGAKKTQISGIDTSESDFLTFIANPTIPSNALLMQDRCWNDDVLRSKLTAIDTCNVTSIGDAVFADCTKMQSFNALYLKELGAGALSNCTSLTSIMIPRLLSIKEKALYNATGLTSVDVLKLQSAGNYAFANCTQLVNASLTAIKTLGSYAFQSDSRLTAVDLGSSYEGLSELSQFTFSGCSKLVEVSLPQSVVKLESQSFANAGSGSLSVVFNGKSQSDLTSILATDNSIGSVVGTKFMTDDFAFYAFLTTKTNEIYKVPYKAFKVEYTSGKHVLTKVDNASIDKSIDASAFKDLSVAAYAFAGCTNLTSISLDSSVSASIAANAFRDMSNLAVMNLSFSYDSSKLNTYLSWIGTSSSSTTSYDVVFSFSDGVLKFDDSSMKWTFSSSSDVFIEDSSTKGRIIGVLEQNASENETIPSKFNVIGEGSLSTTVKIQSLTVGKSIVKIEARAFDSNTSLTSIFLDNATELTSIGDDAFARTMVRSIDIPASNARKMIEGYGLNKAFFLESIKYEDGYTSTALSAMSNIKSMLTSLTLPTTLESIADYTFAETLNFHPAIQQINLVNLTALTSIGDYAFYNSLVTTSKNGQTLTIPKKVQTIGAAAFAYNDDTSLQNLSNVSFAFYDEAEADNALRSIGPSAFMRNHFRNISIPDKCKLSSIGDYAFAYPKYKFSIKIPSQIRKIGVGAFKENVILNPDSISKNIISIDLATAKELLSVMVDPTSPGGTALGSLDDNYEANNSVSASEDTVFLATKGDYHTSYLYVKNGKLNACPEGISVDILNRAVISADKSIVSAFIPEYVHKIGNSAFENCLELTSVSSVNETLEVGERAFFGDKSLEGINLDKEFFLSAVSPSAFYDNESLRNVKLMSSSVSVGEHAFYNCKSISSFQDVVVSDEMYYTLSSIGSNAFEKCTSISSFLIPSDISSIGKDIFKDCSSLTSIIVCMTAEEFKEVAAPSKRTVGESVKDKFSSIRSDAKCRIVFTDSIYMNDGKVKVDSEYVTITGSEDLSVVSEFDYDKFRNDDGSYLNLSNVSEVDQFVFRDAEDLQVINFLSGKQALSSIGDYAFSKCPYLASINGNSLEVAKIGDYAFSGCSLLYKMTINGDKLQHIGQGAFYNTSIQQMTFIVDFQRTGKIADDFLKELKAAIDFDEELNPNPLELPEDAVIIFKDKLTGAVKGKYDYMLNDQMKVDLDINRNQMVFIDKRVNAIKPLLLVKPREGKLPAIVNNKFHMNVIGRWK